MTKAGEITATVKALERWVADNAMPNGEIYMLLDRLDAALASCPTEPPPTDELARLQAKVQSQKSDIIDIGFEVNKAQRERNEAIACTEKAEASHAKHLELAEALYSALNEQVFSMRCRYRCYAGTSSKGR